MNPRGAPPRKTLSASLTSHRSCYSLSHEIAPLLTLLLPLSFAFAADPPFAAEQFSDLAQMPDRTEDFRKQILENNGTLLLESGCTLHHWNPHVFS